MFDMIQLHDKVRHNTFPPIKGYVCHIQPNLNHEDKIGVRVENEDRVYWDYANTWELVDSNSSNTNTSNMDIIDVDYIEID